MGRMGRRSLLAWLAALAGCLGCLPAGAARNGSAPAGASGAGAEATRTFVYAGTAAGTIAIFSLDSPSGRLRARGAVGLGRAPTGMAVARDGRFLVASTDGGMLSSFRVDRKTGGLTLLGRAPSGGAQPTALVADGSGKYVAVANRGSASVSVLPVRPDGSLAPASAFAAELGPRGLAFHPSNEAAFVANFKAETVAQYAFNAGTGTLTPKPDGPVMLPAGSGPKALLPHPNGRWLYVVNETAGTIAVHAVEEHVRTLSLLALQIISPFADGARSKKSALGDVRLGRGGRFLYAVTRAPDGLVTLGIDRSSGDIAVAARTAPQGQGSSAVAIDPSGAFLFVANQSSRTLASFRLDGATGVPAPLGTAPLPAAPVVVETASPAID